MAEKQRSTPLRTSPESDIQVLRPGDIPPLKEVDFHLSTTPQRRMPKRQRKRELALFGDFYERLPEDDAGLASLSDNDDRGWNALKTDMVRRHPDLNELDVNASVNILREFSRQGFSAEALKILVRRCSSLADLEYAAHIHRFLTEKTVMVEAAEKEQETGSQPVRDLSRAEIPRLTLQLLAEERSRKASQRRGRRAWTIGGASIGAVGIVAASLLLTQQRHPNIDLNALVVSMIAHNGSRAVVDMYREHPGHVRAARDVAYRRARLLGHDTTRAVHPGILLQSLLLLRMDRDDNGILDYDLFKPPDRLELDGLLGSSAKSKNDLKDLHELLRKIRPKIEKPPLPRDVANLGPQHDKRRLAKARGSYQRRRV